MKKLLSFVVIWLTNTVLLYLASSFYPFNYVLGNARMSAMSAAFVAGFVWTFLSWLVKPILSIVSLKVEGFWLKCGFYFVVNFIAIWVTARMAPVAGFGVSSFVYVFGLALIAEGVQLVMWNFAVPLVKKM